MQPSPPKLFLTKPIFSLGCGVRGSPSRRNSICPKQLVESGLKPMGKLQERKCGFDFPDQPEAEHSPHPDSAGLLLGFPPGLGARRGLFLQPKKVLPSLAPDRTRISCQSSDGPGLRSLRNREWISLIDEKLRTEPPLDGS